jgi:hypothetical protein
MDGGGAIMPLRRPGEGHPSFFATGWVGPLPDRPRPSGKPVQRADFADGGRGQPSENNGDLSRAWSHDRRHPHHQARDRAKDRLFRGQFADGRESKFFYWDDLPTRRLRPEILNRQEALKLAQVRIPIYSGRVFRREAGHRSDLKPSTIPK